MPKLSQTEIDNEFEELFGDDNIPPPKVGLSGKAHCICQDCDMFGCNPNCIICEKNNYEEQMMAIEYNQVCNEEYDFLDFLGE